MNTMIRVLAGTSGTFAFCALLIWALLNWGLNCQTWDQRFWTESSSCIPPSEFLQMLADTARAVAQKVMP
jgi:hypothetical protein